MSSLSLVLCGLTAELASLVAVLSSQPLWQRVLLFFSGHLVASALFGSLLTAALPKRFSSDRRLLFGLFFSFNFFIPVFGAVGTLLSLLYFRLYMHEGDRAEFVNVPLPPFQVDSAALTPGMGEGGAWSRLRTTGLPREQRLKALLAVGGSGGQPASRLLQHATGDPDDEIRLLAFNLCERQEQKIQQSISAGLAELQQVRSPMERASICRNLAFAYWEMVYTALAQDELRDFYVGQAEQYAEQSRQLKGDDPALALLLARIALQKGEWLKAEDEVQTALALGADQVKVVPYQAELAFHRRDFKMVRRLLRQDKAICFKPGIGPVAQFWGMR